MATTTTEYFVDAYYTLTQQKVLALAPKFTGGISFFSSLIILNEALRDQRQGRGTVVHRVLISMSVFDCMSSLAWFLSSWIVPKGFIVYSQGSRQTCNVGGFLGLAGVGAFLFNVALAVFYLLMINYRWTEERLKRQLEKPVQLALWCWPLLGGTALLLKGNIFHPVGVICWMADNFTCGPDGMSLLDGMPCERHETGWYYSLILYHIPIVLGFVTVSICMGLIYWEVRATHQRMRRYSFDPTNSAALSDHSRRRGTDDDNDNRDRRRSRGLFRSSSLLQSRSGSDGGSSTSLRGVLQSNSMGSMIRNRSLHDASSISNTHHHHQGRSARDVVKTRNKALLYSASFLVTSSFAILWAIFGWSGGSNHPFALEVMSSFLEPLQGFWNLLIFLQDRPRTRAKWKRVLTCGGYLPKSFQWLWRQVMAVVSSCCVHKELEEGSHKNAPRSGHASTETANSSDEMQEESDFNDETSIVVRAICMQTDTSRELSPVRGDAAAGQKNAPIRSSLPNNTRRASIVNKLWNQVYADDRMDAMAGRSNDSSLSFAGDSHVISSADDDNHSNEKTSSAEELGPLPNTDAAASSPVVRVANDSNNDSGNAQEMKAEGSSSKESGHDLVDDSEASQVPSPMPVSAIEPIVLEEEIDDDDVVKDKRDDQGENEKKKKWHHRKTPTDETLGSNSEGR